MHFCGQELLMLLALFENLPIVMFHARCMLEGIASQ